MGQCLHSTSWVTTDSTSSREFNMLKAFIAKMLLSPAMAGLPQVDHSDSESVYHIRITTPDEVSKSVTAEGMKAVMDAYMFFTAQGDLFDKATNSLRISRGMHQFFLTSLLQDINDPATAAARQTSQDGRYVVTLTSHEFFKYFEEYQDKMRNLAWELDTQHQLVLAELNQFRALDSAHNVL